ncbi:LysR family transcriptional regulator [uncultured Desulfovibrio sp.]|uniref:LysR family transcriptional regulator n=1 Tax=uncultured Desulfovibrio sp. TaxID=167968 RepID=UPI00262EEAE2|nr:LysR family transcriptional regulator [uncultured Desulfovibrio sp.]
MLEELNGDFLQWLRGFYYVAKTGSVRQAATLMHRNPSTISYQISSLERELNTQLFERSKKRMHITEDGRKLLEWTITTFEALQGMRADVGCHDGQLRGRVVMACPPAVATLLAAPLQRFIRENPQVDVHILHALSHEVLAAVDEARADIGLPGVTDVPESGSFETLFKARPMLVLRTGHGVSLPAVPTLRDLRNLPFISVAARDRNGHLALPPCGLDRAVDAAQLATVLSVNDHAALLHYARSGLGAAIVDEVCLRAWLGSSWEGLNIQPLDHLFPNVIYGLFLRQRTLPSPQAAALLRLVREHCIPSSAGPAAPPSDRQAHPHALLLPGCDATAPADGQSIPAAAASRPPSR